MGQHTGGACRKGMDLYFKRHDGHAVTCDDFQAAMADANGVDLSNLTTWYRQVRPPLALYAGGCVGWLPKFTIVGL